MAKECKDLDDFYDFVDKGKNFHPNKQVEHTNVTYDPSEDKTLDDVPIVNDPPEDVEEVVLPDDEDDFEADCQPHKVTSCGLAVSAIDPDCGSASACSESVAIIDEIDPLCFQCLDKKDLAKVCSMFKAAEDFDLTDFPSVAYLCKDRRELYVINSNSYLLHWVMSVYQHSSFEGDYYDLWVPWYYRGLSGTYGFPSLSPYGWSNRISSLASAWSYQSWVYDYDYYGGTMRFVWPRTDLSYGKSRANCTCMCFLSYSLLVSQ
jgi:hypothetical protein